MQVQTDLCASATRAARHSGTRISCILSCSALTHCRCTSKVADTGAHVIATARDLKKAPGLQSLLRTHGPSNALQVVTLDVADAASVKVRMA